jgi:hypothetical protein
VYRRFRSTRELATAALEILELAPPPPDLLTASTRDTFLTVMRQRTAAAATTRWNLLMPRLLIESAGDPDLHALVRRSLVDPGRALIVGILQSGIDRGELPSDLDPELAVDMLVGPLVYRVLIDGGDVRAIPDLAAQLFDVLAARAGPPNPEPRR